MIIQDLTTALSTLGYPTAYHHFNNSVPSVPYIVYYSDGASSVYSDDFNCVDIQNVIIELYLRVFDPAVEQKIIEQLQILELPYEIYSRTWIEDEKLWMTAFYVSGF